MFQLCQLKFWFIKWSVQKFAELINHQAKLLVAWVELKNQKVPNTGEGLNKRKYDGSRSGGGIKDGAGDPT